MPRKKPQKNNELTRLESDLIRKNPTIFKGISGPQKKVLITEFTTYFEVQRIHQGPIPDPDTLAGYEDILPGSMDRILSMAENQSKHRMGLEKDVVKHSMKEGGRGQVFAFIIALFTLGAATTMILYGYIWPGGIFGTGGLALIVYLFIQGKNSQFPKNDDGYKSTKPNNETPT